MRLNRKTGTPGLMLALPLLVATLGITPTAYSAFYVVDDEQPQVAMNAAAGKPQVQYVSLPIPRVGKTAWKTTAINKLTPSLPDAMRATRITINSFPKKRNRDLSKDRIAFIRNWYTNNGIGADIIDHDNEPNDPDNDDTLRISIETRAPATIPTPRLPRNAPLVKRTIYGPDEGIVISSSGSQPPIKPLGATPAPTSADVITDPVKLALANRLVGLWQKKVLKSDDVLTLLAEILKKQEATATAAPAPATPSKTTAGHAPMSGAPATISTLMTSLQRIEDAAEPPRNWELSSGKNLQDNIETWALIAGWNKPVWNVKTPYQINSTKTFNGTFMDALMQINDIVPELDFHVGRQQRTLRVTEKP